MDINKEKREKLAEIIKNSREKNGKSQQLIADKVGINVSTLSRFERGKFGINSDILLRIIEEIGVEIEIGKEKI